MRGGGVRVRRGELWGCEKQCDCECGSGASVHL